MRNNERPSGRLLGFFATTVHKAWADPGAGTTERLEVTAQQDQIIIFVLVENGGAGGWWVIGHIFLWLWIADTPRLT